MIRHARTFAHCVAPWRNRACGHRRRGPQRGAAALTVVMVLFFIMALAAGYASRNLIFEQKTSANTYRATQAQEAAEAAVEWTLTMLNGGRVDAACAASVDNANPTFRQRYLTLQDDGNYDFRRWMKDGAETPLVAACVRDINGMICNCPTAADPALATPAQQPAPAYAVIFQNANAPGMIRVIAAGCSFLGGEGTQCHRVPSGAATDTDADAVTQIVAQLGLVRALPAPPVAALTAGNRIEAAAVLEVANTDSRTGVTARAGTTITAGVSRMIVPAGTSGDGRLSSDTALHALLNDDRLFVSLYAMDRTSFGRQPGAVRLECADGCTGAQLATALARNPGRIVWVEGDIDLNTDANLGSAAAPAMVLVNGLLTVSAQVVYTGLLHAVNVQWDATAGAAVIGALVAENDFLASTDVRVAYDAAVLDLIRRGHGSFARVPGGWWDKR